MPTSIADGRLLPDRYVGVQADPGYLVADVFGSVQRRDAGPQVFLVDLHAGHVIRPHFHEVPQFQMLVRGAGWMGNQPIVAPFLHYVDGFTSYGPIRAGEQGISFFTIRATSDVGAHYMPESRHLRSLHRPGDEFEVQLEVLETIETATQRLCGRDERGLAAHEVRTAPGATVDAPAWPGGHRLALVTDGVVSVDGIEYTQYSWIDYGGGSATVPGLTAGSQGARLVYFDFPMH